MLQLRIRCGLVVKRLLLAVALIDLAYLLTQWLRFSWHIRPEVYLIRFFDVDAEATLPTFFSVILLLIASLLLAWVAAEQSARRRPMVLQWAGLACAFVILALDESLQIHEAVSRQVDRVVHTTGALHYAWVIPYSAVTLLLALTYIRFLLQLPRRIALGLVAAGAIYVSGAVGFEMIEAVALESAGHNTIAYASLAGIEETFECLGVITLIGTLLKYIELQRMTLQLGEPSLQPRYEPVESWAA